ncbi:MAG: gephyrin-like molybdotransferase Glp [Bryobacteraceae bacterium]
MAALAFDQARQIVLDRVRSHLPEPRWERIALADTPGRVLAEDLAADRDAPPFDRSMRDGYAVRAADLPGTLSVIGEVRAGSLFHDWVGAHEAVEIMTGAPVPGGADAVVMVEHSRRRNGSVEIERDAQAGQNIALQGSEARAGDVVLRAGVRIDYSHAALAASIGRTRLKVFQRPEVAIVSTGDEIVPVESVPEPFQIRNSNACSLASQVARAGGVPRRLPIVRDTLDSTRQALEWAFESELVLISGGVSMGKYDVVEPALASLGAEFFFDRVAIQPGQPLVFGRARGKFFFGLPGNPASTMVTFEVLARAALELLAGHAAPLLPICHARLARDFGQKPGLTRFLPATLLDGEVTPIGWSGSGDINALARANVFLVTDPGRAEYAAGDSIRILPK